jgi:serine/threonine-protein kinase HipA
VEAIVKIESPDYPGLLALEALCLDLHRRAGFETPRFWLCEREGLRVLAIERFDRDGAGLPLPMESFFSVMSTQGVAGSTSTEMERVGRMLEVLPTLVGLDGRQAGRTVYGRFLLAILTGNGDMHLENLAFLGGPESVRVAPVYDPAPMRAWPRHDLLSAIPFEIEGDLRSSLIRLGRAFGLTPRRAEEELARLAALSADYPALVEATQAAPGAGAPCRRGAGGAQEVAARRRRIALTVFAQKTAPCLRYLLVDQRINAEEFFDRIYRIEKQD